METAEKTGGSDPLVSIIMNCYNGERFLEEALDSVEAQTYKNWEIVFWDNQSTDRSAEIFKSRGSARYRYFYAPKHTVLYEARNSAIQQASGDFYAFLDVDDRWDPSKLSLQMKLFEDAEVGMVCGNFWVLNENKNSCKPRFRQRVPTGWVQEELLRSYYVGILTLVVRRTSLESLDYPCDSRYHIIGDLDLVVRLSRNWKLQAVHRPIAYYRIHGDNESHKNRELHARELEVWINEMQTNGAIQSMRGLKNINRFLSYMKVVDSSSKGDRGSAWRILLANSLGRFLPRAIIHLLLPHGIVKRLRR